MADGVEEMAALALKRLDFLGKVDNLVRLNSRWAEWERTMERLRGLASTVSRINTAYLALSSVLKFQAHFPVFNRQYGFSLGSLRWMQKVQRELDEPEWKPEWDELLLDEVYGLVEQRRKARAEKMRRLERPLHALIKKLTPDERREFGIDLPEWFPQGWTVWRALRRYKSLKTDGKARSVKRLALEMGLFDDDAVPSEIARISGLLGKFLAGKEGRRSDIKGTRKKKAAASRKVPRLELVGTKNTIFRDGKPVTKKTA